jgi:hypothetical protein
MKGIKAAVAEAKLAGNIGERILPNRMATLTEILDPHASRGPIEGFMDKMTDVASKWNGIRMLTDMQKSLASVMTQNRILKNAGDWANLSSSERAYMAYLGIDQSMAERIAKQFEAHGEEIDKVKVAGTDEWDDPFAQRAYRAAVNKDVDSIVVTRGVADVPLFANTAIGRTMLQFKSFALAAHQKVLLRGLQEDQTRFLGGVIALTTFGMMVTYLKALSGNRPETREKMLNNPGWWIGEGYDKAGVTAVFMEAANAVEKVMGVNPIKTPLRMALDSKDVISQKNQNRNKLGSAMGPSFGAIEDFISLGDVPKKLVDGEDITKGQKNALERRLPFNSFPGLRSAIRYTVNTPD